jgi:putative membrane-bound dehydrogenase-like protein
MVACIAPRIATSAEAVVPPKVYWVWDDLQAAETSQSNTPRYLRGVMTLTEKPRQAELFVTVDNRYVAYINGHKLGGDDQWQTIDRYDVADKLVVGPNVVAIEASNGGGVAGAIAWLRLVDSQGQASVFGSDATWRVSQLPSDDWTQAAFDDKSWAKASVLGSANMPPWRIPSVEPGTAVAAKGTTPDVNVSDPSVKEYRSAAEEVTRFELPPGFKMELVAAEPLVINPVCMVFDEQGRMYVSESHTYRYGPKGSPVETPTNPIVRLDPTADGKGLRRIVVAEGFADPVMGMAIRGNQLWATANSFLYRFDLTDAGPATNKTLLLEDKGKAWNPFGMFVLEWGPDGMLYMSVGNHGIDITGPDGSHVSGRGSSGIVLRMQPDGSKLERLVHGLRVPYSFEFDPFGQLWVLSNGEGNPNRFVRVIQGVDYHCYSRPAVSNEWLAGRNALAPPCFELPRGACTQLLRYYGAAYPAEFQGNLFLDNWGAHGFGGPNRTLFRYVTDDHNNIVNQQAWLVCRDPHFRCSHLLLDPAGNLIIADWYGRDDESDLTGRIWRVRYEGTQPTAKDKPAPAATGALWKLARTGTLEAQSAIAASAQNEDWRLRRLALNVLRRGALFASFPAANADALAKTLSHDPDLAVRLEAAITLADRSEKRSAIVGALQAGAAADSHLRYEAAWHLATVLDSASLRSLVRASEENLRLAGLIAIDVSCYENLPARSAAIEVLAELIADPAPGTWDSPLALARLTNDPLLLPALERLGAREDVTAEVTACTILALRAQGGAASNKLGTAATRRFLDSVKSGRVPVTQAADQLLLLELLAGEAPTPFALREVQSRLFDRNIQLRDKAHELARNYGPRAAPVAGVLKGRLLDLNSKTAPTERLQQLATLVAIDPQPDAKAWARLLLECEPTLALDALRSWRTFAGNAVMTQALVECAPQALARDANWADDPRAVLTHLKVTDAIVTPAPKVDAADEVGLRAYLLSANADDQGPGLGRRVFERASCVKCHTTVSENALRAPSLQGIGKAQKIDYLVESIFEPSKVIKTGFEIETIVTTSGITYNGLVKEEAGCLRIITVDNEVILEKSDIEARAVQKKSLMPEGLYKGLSPGELRDLLSYLQSLK